MVKVKRLPTASMRPRCNWKPPTACGLRVDAADLQRAAEFRVDAEAAHVDAGIAGERDIQVEPAAGRRGGGAAASAGVCGIGGVKPGGALTWSTSMAFADPPMRSGNWISVRPRSMLPDTTPLPSSGPLTARSPEKVVLSDVAVGVAAVADLHGEVGRQAALVGRDRAGQHDVAALREAAGDLLDRRPAPVEFDPAAGAGDAEAGLAVDNRGIDQVDGAVTAGAASAPPTATFTLALPARRSSRLELSASSVSGTVPLAFTSRPATAERHLAVDGERQAGAGKPGGDGGCRGGALAAGVDDERRQAGVRVAASAKPVQSICQSIRGEDGVPVTLARPLSEPSAPRPGAKPLTAEAASFVAATVRSSCGETAPSMLTVPPPSVNVAAAIRDCPPSSLIVNGWFRPTGVPNAVPFSASMVTARVGKADDAGQVDVRPLGAGFDARRAALDGCRRLDRVETAPADDHRGCRRIAAHLRCPEGIGNRHRAVDPAGRDVLPGDVGAIEPDGDGLAAAVRRQPDARLRRP